LQQIDDKCLAYGYICDMKSTFSAFLLLLLIIGFASCGDSPKVPQQELQVNVDTLVFGSTYDFPSMDAAVSNILTDWAVFLEFRAEATELHDLKLEPLRNKLLILQAHADTMIVRLPDTLNTPAIESRLRIISTRINLLRQEAAKDRLYPKRVETEIDETNEAIKNLFVQINEKVQKDGIDRNRSENEKAELEKQQRFRDSIFELERQDQQN